MSENSSQLYTFSEYFVALQYPFFTKILFPPKQSECSRQTLHASDSLNNEYSPSEQTLHLKYFYAG